jgi:glutamate-1-semialdehyde 2,1-aminomutase
MPGGNTRTTLHYGPFPLAMQGGRGSHLTDVDGHSYVDFVNEHTAGLFGHSDPVIGEALHRAIDGGFVLGAPNPFEHRLAEALVRRFAAIERVRFCNSGTEANLLALAAARAFTGREAVLVFHGAYHGSLLYFGHGASPLNMPFPVVLSTFNDADRAVADIDAHAGRLAAVLVEPMQGSAGALPAEPGFLEALREACTRHGIVLILDEVMTSRLGPGGVQGRLGLVPDMTTLGKYVGGGMTIGAFGGRADIMGRFDPGRAGAWSHGGTFNNNILAMAAGVAALEQVLTAAAVEALNARGDRLRQALAGLAGRHGLPVVVTGMGSIFGFHFHRGPARNEAELDAFARGRGPALDALKTLFQLDLFAMGQHVTRRILGNLSLANSDAEVDGLVACIDEFLSSRGALIREVAG